MQCTLTLYGAVMVVAWDPSELDTPLFHVCQLQISWRVGSLWWRNINRHFMRMKNTWLHNLSVWDTNITSSVECLFTQAHVWVSFTALRDKHWDMLMEQVLLNGESSGLSQAQMKPHVQKQGRSCGTHAWNQKSIKEETTQLKRSWVVQRGDAGFINDVCIGAWEEIASARCVSSCMHSSFAHSSNLTVNHM